MFEKLQPTAVGGGAQLGEVRGSRGMAKAVDDRQTPLAERANGGDRRGDADPGDEVNEGAGIVVLRANGARGSRDPQERAWGGLAEPVGKKAAIFEFNAQFVAGGGEGGERLRPAYPAFVHHGLDANMLAYFCGRQDGGRDGLEAGQEHTFSQRLGVEVAEAIITLVEKCRQPTATAATDAARAREANQVIDGGGTFRGTTQSRGGRIRAAAHNLRATGGAERGVFD